MEPHDGVRLFERSCISVRIQGDAPRNFSESLSHRGWTICSTPPFEIGEPWRKWQGEVAIEHFSQAKLFLLSETQSELAFDIGTVEAGRAERDVWRLLHSVLLQGIPPTNGAQHVSDSAINQPLTRPEVRGAFQLFPTIPWWPGPVGDEVARRALALAEAFLPLDATADSFVRLKKGIAAWMRGVQMSSGDDRLHQFVRALDALCFTSPGNGKKELRERLQRVTSGLSGSELGELYDLRSQVEHLNEISPKVPHERIKDIERLGTFRIFQAERLAAELFMRVLKRESLRCHFESDDSIRKLWQLPNTELLELWGDRIDLGDVLERSFFGEPGVLE